MAIGIVSDDDLQDELDRLSGKKPMPTIIESNKEHGRNKGDVNVPDSLRKIIGETAVIDGRQEALALGNLFGLSSSSVSAYTKGSTSTSSIDTPKKSIVDHINKSRKRYIKKAGQVLTDALSKIDENKLNEVNARELASIARDMSVVIKNLEPPAPTKETEDKNTPQFVIFAPQFRDERSFDSITVSE